ncbi:hypothetical protein AZE42_00616 [Rhizopogon vesiculosus]|uniref:Uncharacterized protein n=1 Tax=Rhizopogon vesiculosus TaxID=180088 RepID=A0A1J8Q693_9AGAM|nr:hypothetical protein AZE42_00616 [Rhizopogon vesiculosus]
MPKRKVGHLNNLGGHAERNTKKTRISKEQKKEKGNVQHTRIGPNLAGIPFLNSAFSPPLQDLLNSLPTAPPIDTVNPPFWLEADLFLDAANIIRQRVSLLLPQDVSDAQPIPAHDKIFTTTNSDHASASRFNPRGSQGS